MWANSEPPMSDEPVRGIHRYPGDFRVVKYVVLCDEHEVKVLKHEEKWSKSEVNQVYRTNLTKWRNLCCSKKVDIITTVGNL